MNTQQRRRVVEIFHAACEMDATERAAYVEGECADDSEIRDEVQKLLAADARPEPIEMDLTEEAPQGRPERIGAYRIVDRLAAGGMGVVYLAEQEHPQRRVAVKVMAPFASERAERRFELEAHILGRLQHPGIAQIFEAGTYPTEAGPRPFFAMELIDGQSLLDYAGAKSLTTRARLEMLAEICDAVQHAHQKGVVHRDLKPSNIMVDRQGRPRILDFGIARLMDDDAQSLTAGSGVVQLMGTIPYMSPEQARGDVDLDTRSDVYALGVVGYELLTGHLPHDVRDKPKHVALRTIVEEPPTPISRVSRILRGDVERIFAKALAKDREHRYPAAAALGSDLRRYLRSEPIAARPLSATYQLRKFARRHKAMVAGVVVTLFALAAGLISSTVLYLQAEDARRQAQAEADKFTAAEELLHSAVQSAGLRGDPQRAGEELAAAISRVSTDDETTGALHGVVASVLVLTNSFAQAEEHLRRKIELQRQDRTDSNDRILGALIDHGLGRRDQAIATLREELPKLVAALGPRHRHTLTVQSNLAAVLNEIVQLDEAEGLAREAVDGLRDTAGRDDRETLRAEYNLAAILKNKKRFREALEVFDEALAGHRRVFGAEHAYTAIVQSARADCLRYVGRFDEAETEALAAFDALHGAFGTDDERTQNARSILSGLYSQGMMRPCEAAPWYHDMVESYRRTRGRAAGQTLITTSHLMSALASCQRWTDVEEVARATLLALDETGNVNSQARPISLGRLAASLENLDRCDEAIEAHGRLIEWYAARPEPQDQSNFYVGKLGMGACLLRKREYDKAEAQLKEAHEGMRRLKGTNHAETRRAIQTLIALYEAWGRPEDAEAWRSGQGEAPQTP